MLVLVPSSPKASPCALPLGLLAVSTGIWVQALHAVEAALVQWGHTSSHCTWLDHAPQMLHFAHAKARVCTSERVVPTPAVSRAQNPRQAHGLGVRPRGGCGSFYSHLQRCMCLTQNLYFELEKIAPR